MALSSEMYKILYELEKKYGKNKQGAYRWPSEVKDSDPKLKRLRKIANGNSRRKITAESLGVANIRMSILDGFPNIYAIGIRFGLSKSKMQDIIQNNSELHKLYKNRQREKVQVVALKNGEVVAIKSRADMSGMLSVGAKTLQNHILNGKPIKGYVLITYPQYEKQRQVQVLNG